MAMVYSPLNEKHEIKNRAKFCEDHGLNYLGFSNMMNGKSKSYKGWRLKKDTKIKPEHGNPKSIKTVVSPNGNLKKVYNRAEFCRENNLNYQCFMQMLSGRSKSYKGWVVKNDK